MIYNIIKSNSSPQLILLIDPENQNETTLKKLIDICHKYHMPFLMIGGSLVSNFLDSFIMQLQKLTQIPILLFPGSLMQISNKANALLLLSLLSGRNPEFLIGNHVIAAPYLKKSGLEIIPTGYILIESGSITSVQYMSNTMPIPANKIDIILATAMAGELLGHKIIYLEAGSGAKIPVSPSVVEYIKTNISTPLFVGGGIRTPELIENYAKAGVNFIVVGNSVENNPSQLENLLKVLH